MNLPARFQVKTKIASGATATVYLAEDTILKRNVALKIIHPHLTGHASTIKRLEIEGRAIAALDHPNIVKLYDFCEFDNMKFLVMEYLEGKTLLEILDPTHTLPNLVTISIMSQIFSGLVVAHQGGIFHRDIKPNNIMIDQNGNIRIMDFGIAYLVDREGLTLTGDLLGTPNYIAPEQISGGGVSAKVDIFSVGALSYQCLTGRPPFCKDSVASTLHSIVADVPVPPSNLNASIMPWLETLIVRCLEKNPIDRPDATECLNTINTECLVDGIESSYQNIEHYLLDSNKVTANEKLKLHASYTKKAFAFYQKKEFAYCIKSLDYANVLDSSAPLNKKLYAKLKARQRTTKALAATLILVGISICFMIVIKYGFNSKLDILKNDYSNNYFSPEIKADTGIHNRVVQNSYIENRKQTDKVVRSSKKNNIITNKNNFVSASIVSGKPESPGYLFVKTSPPWAEVAIDNISYGKTPLKAVIPIVAGEHRIAFKKDGFFDSTQLINICSANTTYVKILLQPSTIPR